MLYDSLGLTNILLTLIAALNVAIIITLLRMYYSKNKAGKQDK